jgi:hypothetical protein
MEILAFLKDQPGFLTRIPSDGPLITIIGADGPRLE